MVEGKVARVHDVVVQWLDYMSGLPACEPGSTAIGSLLEVVKNNLLAVELPKGMGSMTGSPRRRSLSNMAPRTSDVDVMPASSSTASFEANMAPGLPSENENSEIQVGLVRLPPLNSDAHFEVIRQWLADCDENHGCMTTDSYKPISATRSQLLPTRVIDVSPPGSTDVRPVETARGSTGRWIAVSHQWGAKPWFCTVKSNLASHLKGIPLSSLPATFADAVKVTRALGCQYLWIDSICVVQKEEDDPGDFNKEMKNMEQYYSGAYCVLGLSAGEGHGAGFLAERKRREVVTKHVLQGPLRSRGWVLQEHALARRTVFFTEAQTYWECGEGVKCETGTRMNNTRAAFLGDLKFPNLLNEC
ncbi:hypothetical protein QC763_601970 [Podospora pseudopauciseta]|uniref:Heterokaryon incompatibility domain-containing protein n=1 Tax=Podospora pseudopauciseta TaxID=2093780 RepID=A0ABR0H4G1_9PEZI|nr:hypothetical protein QC763_601970 [Podospora pseudopauciseta]